MSFTLILPGSQAIYQVFSGYIDIRNTEEINTRTLAGNAEVLLCLLHSFSHVFTGYIAIIYIKKKVVIRLSTKVFSSTYYFVRNTRRVAHKS